MTDYHLGDFADIQNISSHGKKNQPMTNDLAFQVGYERGIQDAADEAEKLLELISIIVDSHDDGHKYYRCKDEADDAERAFTKAIKRLLGEIND